MYSSNCYLETWIEVSMSFPHFILIFMEGDIPYRGKVIKLFASD